MLRWDFEGFVGAFGFHIRGFLALLFFLIGVLSDECVEVVDIALFGLEEVLDLFKFEDRLFDLTNVHVWKETDDIIFLIFIVSVNRYNEDIGQE